jgi:hypothetical protein
MAMTTDPGGGKAPAGGFQQGGWYSGYQYYNGTFAPQAGVIHPESTQVGAGQAVSNDVVSQTNPANVAYIAAQNAKGPVATPTTTGGGATGSSGGGSLASTLGTGTNGQPTFDLVSATNAAYNTPEIQAANKAVSDANAELISKQTARDTALANEADNPFYSAATLTGKQAKINAKYNADALVIQNKISQAQGQVATLKADAAIKVNAALGQYNINEQSYKDQLTQFNNIVSMGGLDNASAEDIANLSVQTGIPSSMIQSIQQKSASKDTKVQIVQSTDDAGNLNLIAVDQTGKVVNTTTIAGAGKATKETAAKETTPSTENQNVAVGKIVQAYLSDKKKQDQISPEDLYRELLLQYPNAQAYLAKNFTAEQIRAILGS